MVFVTLRGTQFRMISIPAGRPRSKGPSTPAGPSTTIRMRRQRSADLSEAACSGPNPFPAPESTSRTSVSRSDCTSAKLSPVVRRTGRSRLQRRLLARPPARRRFDGTPAAVAMGPAGRIGAGASGRCRISCGRKGPRQPPLSWPTSSARGTVVCCEVCSSFSTTEPAASSVSPTTTTNTAFSRSATLNWLFTDRPEASMSA